MSLTIMIGFSTGDHSPAEPLLSSLLRRREASHHIKLLFPSMHLSVLLDESAQTATSGPSCESVCC